MIPNKHKVSQSVWQRWTLYGQDTFNKVYATLPPLYPASSRAIYWNTAFFAACEASGLDIEYEPKGGWR